MKNKTPLYSNDKKRVVVGGKVIWRITGLFIPRSFLHLPLLIYELYGFGIRSFITSNRDNTYNVHNTYNVPLRFETSDEPLVEVHFNITLRFFTSFIESSSLIEF